jgi:hypothetical protein
MRARAAIPFFVRCVRAAIVGASSLILAGALQMSGAELDSSAERPRLTLVGTVAGSGKALALFNDCPLHSAR